MNTIWSLCSGNKAVANWLLKSLWHKQLCASQLWLLKRVFWTRCKSCPSVRGIWDRNLFNKRGVNSKSRLVSWTPVNSSKEYLEKQGRFPMRTEDSYAHPSINFERAYEHYGTRIHLAYHPCFVVGNDCLVCALAQVHQFHDHTLCSDKVILVELTSQVKRCQATRLMLNIRRGQCLIRHQVRGKITGK